jgi:hypothetical protein
MEFIVIFKKNFDVTVQPRKKRNFPFLGQCSSKPVVINVILAHKLLSTAKKYQT